MITKQSTIWLVLLGGLIIFLTNYQPLRADGGRTFSYQWGDGAVYLTVEGLSYAAGQQTPIFTVKIKNQGVFKLYYTPRHFWLESDDLVRHQAVGTSTDNQAGFLPIGSEMSLELTFALSPGQTGQRLIYKPVAFLDEEASLLIDPDLLPSVSAPAPASSTPADPAPDYTNKILFWSDRPEGIGIYMMDPDGTNQTLIDDYDNYYIGLETDHYSPDGCNKLFVREVCGRNQLCYVGNIVREDFAGDTQIWAQNLRTKEPFSLVGAALGLDYDPAWSPDNEHIVFVSQQVGNDEIHIYEIPTNWDRRLTTYPGLDKDPTVSPDGTHIAFWSNRTGRRQIWVMDVNGENLRNISNNTYNDWKPVWWKPRPTCQP